MFSFTVSLLLSRDQLQYFLLKIIRLTPYLLLALSKKEHKYQVVLSYYTWDEALDHTTF